MAWASTVAVVVPSPATSDVLLATSFTIWAPMFSSGSFSSISLATVTPSLVMVGEPNFLSRMTLRPLGPSVTLTALARRLTPRRMACRDSSPYVICFAMDARLLLLLCRGDAALRVTARTSSSRRIRTSSPSILMSVPGVLAEEDPVADLDVEGRACVPFSRSLPLPTAMTSPSCGFSLAVSGMMMPPFAVAFSSMRRTTSRSCSGRTFITSPLSIRFRRVG